MVDQFRPQHFGRFLIHLDEFLPHLSASVAAMAGGVFMILLHAHYSTQFFAQFLDHIEIHVFHFISPPLHILQQSIIQ
jgi:hypothetical protein